MADHFLGALKEIERRSRDNTLIFSDVLSERLDGIAESMISTKLSDNDYMKLLELYYQKYHKQEKKKAMMYCILRIQQMAECKKMKKFNKNIKYIEFSDSFDEYTLAFLNKKRPYYKNMALDFKKKALFISLIISIIFLALIVLVCNVSFVLSWILSLIMYVGSYITLIRVGYPYVFENRLMVLQEEIDPLCLAVDLSVHPNSHE